MKVLELRRKIVVDWQRCHLLCSTPKQIDLHRSYFEVAFPYFFIIYLSCFFSLFFHCSLIYGSICSLIFLILFVISYCMVISYTSNFSLVDFSFAQNKSNYWIFVKIYNLVLLSQKWCIGLMDDFQIQSTSASVKGLSRLFPFSMLLDQKVLQCH